MLEWMKSWGSARNRGPIADAQPTPKRQVGEVSGEYRSLHKYLDNRYANTVVLTFSQIEDLLGFALPDLARTDHAWWTSAAASTAASPHSRAWILAGRTATPNLSAHNVAFERQRESSR